jgi:hypothetical protein
MTVTDRCCSLHIVSLSQVGMDLTGVLPLAAVILLPIAKLQEAVFFLMAGKLQAHNK